MSPHTLTSPSELELLTTPGNEGYNVLQLHQAFTRSA